MKKTDAANIVEAQLYTGGVLHLKAKRGHELMLVKFTPIGFAAILLHELITIHGIIQQEREIREQVQTVVDEIGARVRFRRI